MARNWYVMKATHPSAILTKSSAALENCRAHHITTKPQADYSHTHTHAHTYINVYSLIMHVHTQNANIVFVAISLNSIYPRKP